MAKNRIPLLIFISFVFVSLLALTLAMSRSSWYKSGPAEAAAFGISPPHFLNLDLRPGDEFSRRIALMRTGSASTRIVRLTVEAPGFADWLSFDPGEVFHFWSGEDKTSLNIAARIPPAAEPGIYRGHISVAIAPGYEAAAAIGLGARIEVELQVLGDPDPEPDRTISINAPVDPGRLAPSALPANVEDSVIYQKLKGRFIIRPQKRGELYYVDALAPIIRYLPDSQSAWLSLGQASLGVGNSDLGLIEPAPERPADPSGLARRLAGRILLQAESEGELWYVHPTDFNRYNLVRPRDAFFLVQLLATGISEADYLGLVRD